MIGACVSALLEIELEERDHPGGSIPPTLPWQQQMQRNPHYHNNYLAAIVLLYHTDRLLLTLLSRVELQDNLGEPMLAAFYHKVCIA